MLNRYFLGMMCMCFFALSFSQTKLYNYQYKGKFGLVDDEGNLKTKVEFDQIVDLKGDDWTNTNAILLTKNGKFGLMNYEGKWIFEPKFQDIFCKNDSCRITDNDKVGYATSTGKIIIPNSYDNLGFISDKKIKALQNGKWGFINLENEWVIPLKFSETIYDISDFSEGLVKICLRDQEKSCGYIDVTGKIVISQIYDEYSGDFHNGLAKTAIDGKINYLNKSGKIAFKSDWDYSSDSNFSFGVAVVSKNCRQFDDYGVCESYLINTKGVNVLPRNSEIVRSFPDENYTVVRDQKTQKLGVVNNLGEVIIPLNFTDIGNFGGPFDWIEVSNYNNDQYEMTGFYDRKGKKITDCIYSICGSYYEESDPNGEDFICIERQNGEGRGALNKYGKETIPPDYEEVNLADQLFSVSKLDRKLEIGGIYNPSCGYIDLSGNLIIPLQYKSCSRFNNGFASVFDNKGWKIINKKNEIIKDLAWFIKCGEFW